MFLVARGGIEPPTQGFSIFRSLIQFNRANIGANPVKVFSILVSILVLKFHAA